MEDREELLILSVATTVGSAADAQRLARELVEGRLAACVQVDAAIRSSYWWQGRLCEDEEVRLVIKTLPGLEQALREFFAERHPYDVPQFLAVVMRASETYAAWVRETLARSP